MTTGGNDAEAAIVVKAINEASEELEQIQGDTDDVSESLFGFSRNAVAAGIAALGLSFGLKEALEAGGRAIEVDAQTDAILRLLGPEVEAAFRNIEPLFGEIADGVVATASEVEKAALTITQNSGGIVPSIEELAFAFDLAAAAGVPLETAAAAVGQALQGNIQPLNDLLDPSGRSFISLADAMRDLEGASEDSASGFDRLKNEFDQLLEALGKGVIDDFFNVLADGVDWFTDNVLPLLERAFRFALENPLTTFGSLLAQFVFGPIGVALAVFEQFGEEIGRVFSRVWELFKQFVVDPITDFFTDLPNLIADGLDGLKDFFGGAFDNINPFVSNPTSGGGNTSIVINGNVDSAERASQLAREVARQMRETNRRGVGISAGSVA